MKIEVCINRLEDVHFLQSFAVDRIELCIELGCGGLTPSLAMIEKAVSISKIPIHVLVRPRSGDFIYDEETYATLLQDCVSIQSLGVAGIVTGGLTPEGSLPVAFLAQLRNNLSDCALYFHRAFDDVAFPENALSELIKLGFDGVLSSGQHLTAHEGIENLKHWKDIAEGKLIVMPGSGIDASNVFCFKEAGFEWVHLSAKRELTPSSVSLFNAPQYGLNQRALKDLIDKVESNE